MRDYMLGGGGGGGGVGGLVHYEQYLVIAGTAVLAIFCYRSRVLRPARTAP